MDKDINIPPHIWGPSAWKLLHYITFAYPVNPTYDDKLNYKKINIVKI